MEGKHRGQHLQLFFAGGGLLGLMLVLKARSGEAERKCRRSEGDKNVRSA